MMTTKEKITIMQAFVDGKPIQYKFKENPTNKWMDFSEYAEPSWSWDIADFRVKPEAKVRPYTFEEMCEAVKKHGAFVRFLEGMVFSIRSIGLDEIEVGDDEMSYQELLKRGYIWLDDNSPCGVVEE